MTSRFASQAVASSTPAGEALPQPAQSTHPSAARYITPGVLAVALTLIALALRLYRLDGRSFFRIFLRFRIETLGFLLIQRGGRSTIINLAVAGHAISQWGR